MSGMLWRWRFRGSCRGWWGRTKSMLLCSALRPQSCATLRCVCLVSIDNHALPSSSSCSFVWRGKEGKTHRGFGGGALVVIKGVGDGVKKATPLRIKSVVQAAPATALHHQRV